MDKEINLPPFYIGETIECIKSHIRLRYVKGERYVVKGIKQCKCGSWGIDIGVLVSPGYSGTSCNKCKSSFNTDNTLYCLYENFRSLHQNFQSISLSEVMENETKLIGVN